jgi:hypothetical protein
VAPPPIPKHPPGGCSGSGPRWSPWWLRSWARPEVILGPGCCSPSIAGWVGGGGFVVATFWRSAAGRLGGSLGQRQKGGLRGRGTREADSTPAVTSMSSSRPRVEDAAVDLPAHARRGSRCRPCRVGIGRSRWPLPGIKGFLVGPVWGAQPYAPLSFLGEAGRPLSPRL